MLIERAALNFNAASGDFLAQSGSAILNASFSSLQWRSMIWTGVLSTMLEPTKKRRKGGRTPDRSEIWVARAGIAGAAQCFLAANLSAKRVIIRILEREKEIAVLVRTGATIDLSVFSWLNHFTKKKVPAGARGSWESYSSHIDRFKGYQPSEAEWLHLGDMFLDIACKQATRIAASSRLGSNLPG